MTRDRIIDSGEWQGRVFDVIDTGGIDPDDPAPMSQHILQQAKIAIADAHALLFVVDARAGITAIDRDLARLLVKCAKPVFLVANKCDSPKMWYEAQSFYELGFERVFPVSAEHGLNVGDLLDELVQILPKRGAPKDEKHPEIKVAIIGKPNVGKSTLLNKLSRQNRSIVSAAPGTTRDVVDSIVVRNGTRFRILDTAGIRKKSRTVLMAEKLSVVMARRHIRMAHVVLLMLDATEGIVGLDTTIAGYAHEGGRALIVCVNKWDEMKGHSGQKRNEFEEQIRYQFKFLEYAPIVFISAATGSGVSKLFKMIKEAYESASRRVTTGELNRFVADLHFEERKIFYITQHSIRPPAFAVFTDKGPALHFSHERYLINQMRKKFGFFATPILLQTKAKKPKVRGK